MYYGVLYDLKELLTRYSLPTGSSVKVFLQTFHSSAEPNKNTRREQLFTMENGLLKKRLQSFAEFSCVPVQKRNMWKLNQA